MIVTPATAYAHGLRDGYAGLLGTHPSLGRVLHTYPELSAWEELVSLFIAGYHEGRGERAEA